MTELRETLTLRLTTALAPLGALVRSHPALSLLRNILCIDRNYRVSTEAGALVKASEAPVSMSAISVLLRKRWDGIDATPWCRSISDPRPRIAPGSGLVSVDPDNVLSCASIRVKAVQSRLQDGDPA